MSARRLGDAAKSLRMSKQVLIAGAGIGGLAAALACSRAGWKVRVFERAAEFSEVGAGIQIGPNVVRVLRGFGLEAALAQVAAFPGRLQVRNALSGGGARRCCRSASGRCGCTARPMPRFTARICTELLLEALQQRDDVRLGLGKLVGKLP